MEEKKASVVSKELQKEVLEMEESVFQIESIWKKISHLLEDSSRCWEGEAGAVHQIVYRKEGKEVMEQVIHELREDLFEMYQITGLQKEESKEKENGLPGNVLI